MDISPTEPESVVVVGASLAGLRAAEELRRRGFLGSVAMVGEENHPPYDRPPLSKGFLAGITDVGDLNLTMDSDQLNLDWYRGRRAESLVAATRTVRLDDGTELVGSRGVIIATGAKPRLLPEWTPRRGLHVLRTLDDALALRADLDASPSRVVVVGAGFIGAEVASTCRKRGLNVTLLEALDVPMARGLSPMFGNALAQLHRDNGVDLQTGVAVEKIVGDERVEQVRLSDGANIDCDVVVVGIGVIPNTDWLADSGLTIDNGVVCDETLSAYPGIVAAGDICRWPNRLFGNELTRIEHWTNAVEQGIAAATRLLDENTPPFTPVPFVWSDQYDVKIQIVGQVRPDDEVLVFDGSIDSLRFTAISGQAGVFTGAVGFSRPRLVMQCRRLIADSTPWPEAVKSLTAKI